MKMKQNYNIKKSLLRLLPFVMLMAPACKKNKVEPTLPEPIEQHDVVIDWTWGLGMGLAPSKDSVAYYTKQPEVRYVYINLVPTGDMYGSTYNPRHFRKARDTLQSRIDVNPYKVHGSGIVRVGRDGAHIHPDTITKKYGMWEPDSVWFANHGWTIERFPRQHCK